MFNSSFGNDSFHRFGGNESCYDRNFSYSYKKNFENNRQKNFDFENRSKPINRSFINVQPVCRKPYVEHIAIKNRPQNEIDNWYIQNEVIIDGQNIPRPIFEFDESSFSIEIKGLLNNNYVSPTTIQSISWPVALSGRDMISIAKTGSGKTLGFILPAIMHIKSQPARISGDGPIALVLLPTRELAQQVEQVAKEYCYLTNISLVCCFGGASKIPQTNELRQGVDICVATPGRLLDFLQSSVTNLNRCSYFVLDEADRMLDMGFEPQIRRILSNIRSDRQTLMFSATWPKEVRSLASSFLKNPIFLNVGSLELSANHNIDQNVFVVNEYDKPNHLFDLLTFIGKQNECKTIIFVETKRRANDLTSKMRQGGWPAMCIHGDKSQSERDFVMDEFRSGRTLILLATDVAARGLDVSDIKYVINYDYPKNSEDYVHRIGRTGRCDQKGTSFTLFTTFNASKARDLIKVLEEARQEIPASLARMVGSSGDFKKN